MTGQRITPAEQAAVEAALRAAMTQVGVYAEAVWLSSRWPPVVRYYPHLDLTETCGGSGWYDRPLINKL
jgi:hypothetical protein